MEHEYHITVLPIKYPYFIDIHNNWSCKSLLKNQNKVDFKSLRISLSLSKILFLLGGIAISFILFTSLLPHTVNAASNNSLKIDIEPENKNYAKRIAFVEPTFTYAAYHYNSFYNFYDKYSPLRFSQPNTTIISDLYLLKDRPIPHGPFPYYSHPTYLDIPYKDYYDLLLQHVKKNSTGVTNLTDVDVHLGKIFQTNGKNAYDVLFLFHNEYLTQTEYDNLKNFVFNGGKIVFTDANILYAEVSYNKTLDSITLVNGHAWKFDGKKAQNSIQERWLNENKVWMGSNFFDVSSREKVLFRNNPFHYYHTEEQYVTNPNAKVLLDYQVYNIPKQFIAKYPNPTIATYEINYGKGKIINLGIWGHVLTQNTEFIKYFDNVILPLAFDLPIKYILPSHDKSVFSNTTSIDQNSSSNLMLVSTNKSKIAVNYSLPFDLESIQGKFISICEPASGSIFPVGDTMVKCTSRDKADNNTAISKFMIRIINGNMSG